MRRLGSAAAALPCLARFARDLVAHRSGPYNQRPEGVARGGVGLLGRARGKPSRVPSHQRGQHVGEPHSSGVLLPPSSFEPADDQARQLASVAECRCDPAFARCRCASSGLPLDCSVHGPWNDLHDVDIRIQQLHRAASPSPGQMRRFWWRRRRRSPGHVLTCAIDVTFTTAPRPAFLHGWHERVDQGERDSSSSSRRPRAPHRRSPTTQIRPADASAGVVDDHVDASPSASTASAASDRAAVSAGGRSPLYHGRGAHAASAAYLLRPTSTSSVQRRRAADRQPCAASRPARFASSRPIPLDAPVSNTRLSLIRELPPFWKLLLLRALSSVCWETIKTEGSRASATNAPAS